MDAEMEKLIEELEEAKILMKRAKGIGPKVVALLEGSNLVGQQRTVDILGHLAGYLAGEMMFNGTSEDDVIGTLNEIINQYTPKE